MILSQELRKPVGADGVQLLHLPATEDEGSPSQLDDYLINVNLWRNAVTSGRPRSLQLSQSMMWFTPPPTAWSNTTHNITAPDHFSILQSYILPCLDHPQHWSRLNTKILTLFHVKIASLGAKVADVGLHHVFVVLPVPLLIPILIHPHGEQAVVSISIMVDKEVLMEVEPVIKTSIIDEQNLDLEIHIPCESRMMNIKQYLMMSTTKAKEMVPRKLSGVLSKSVPQLFLQDYHHH